MSAPVSLSAPVDVIDGGCTTLRGLCDRCELFAELYGPGRIVNHPQGFLYQCDEGPGRILVKLEGATTP